MYNSLNIGRTGIKSMQFKMDGIANDLANANTHGYKSKSINFRELLNSQEVSVGSKALTAKINFNQGIIESSDYGYHLAIEGDGFFGVADENGTLMLSRNGGFHIDESNRIFDDNGYPLVVDYIIDPEQWQDSNVTITADGRILSETALMDDEYAYGEEENILGRIILFMPESLDSLASLGENRYLPSPNSALYSSDENPEMFGNIIQGALEGSNVDIISSMAEMISTQRAYSLNSKAIESTDDIMRLINDIKR